MEGQIVFANSLDLTPEKSEHEVINYNGFIIIANHRPNAKTVLVESYINNGNVDEEKHNMGISHLLEHVCTDGWEKCKKNCSELWKKKGAVMNASTGQTYVNYYIHALNQYAYDLIDYVVSISTTPVVTKLTTNKEKAAVINELLIHSQNAQLAAYQKLNHNLFNVEGLQLQDDIYLQIKNLKKIDHKMLQKWVDKYYGAGNTIFCITGDLSEKKSNPNRKSKILKHIEHKLTKFKKSKRRPFYSNIFTPGVKVKYVKNTKIDNTTIYFTFHSPLVYKDVEVHYIEFFKLFINSSMTSILMYELRENYKLIYNIQLDNYTTQYGTYITIEISTKNKNITEVVKRTLGVLNKIVNGDFPNEHLSYVKKSYLVNSENTNKNNAWVSTWYAEQYIHQLHNINNPTVISNKNLIKKIKKMNKSDFISFAKKLIIFSNFKLIYNGKKEIPNLSKKVLEWID